MKQKEKRTKIKAKRQQSHKPKQTKANISKNLHKIWQHKSCANILIKLMRLMEAWSYG